MPSVSVVIPTRNRAHLLKVAIESALRQTWQDLEILVSDNYCGNEETRNVYASFRDTQNSELGHHGYFRTDKNADNNTQVITETGSTGISFPGPNGFA